MTAPLISSELTARLVILQALDDAIKLRFGCIGLDCEQPCAPRSRCDAHAGDDRLIEMYQHAYAGQFSAAVASLDARTIEQVTSPAAGQPARHLTREFILARLRELAGEHGPPLTRPATPAPPSAPPPG